MPDGPGLLVFQPFEQSPVIGLRTLFAAGVSLLQVNTCLVGFCKHTIFHLKLGCVLRQVIFQLLDGRFTLSNIGAVNFFKQEFHWQQVVVQLVELRIPVAKVLG